MKNDRPEMRHPPAQPALLLRRRDVLALLGISHSALYRYMHHASFPRPIRIGPKAVRWRRDEIERWIEARPRAMGGSRFGR